MARHGRGLAIVPTAPERLRSRDSEHPYRHDSNFHHLTGFDEPEAWLLIDERGHSVLLCREKNAEREIWDGRRLGPESAVGTLGVDEAFPMEALDKVLVERLTHRDTVWLPFDRDGLQGQVQGWLAEVRQRDRTGAPAPSMLRDIGPLLAEMRLIKDDSELATMRRAAQISAGAHARAMRFCAEHFREPTAEALPEYRIEAELLHEFRRHVRAEPGLHLHRRRGCQCLRAAPLRRRHAAAARRALPDRRRLRTRRICQRRDADVSRQWPLFGRPARALRHRAGCAGCGRGLYAAGSTSHRRSRCGGARAGARHARHGDCCSATRSGASTT